MAIFFGNKKIAEIYFGTTKIHAVYEGSTLVWSGVKFWDEGSTKLPDPTSTIVDRAWSVGFTTDGKYVAVGFYRNTNIKVYKTDNDTLTDLGIPGIPATGRDVKFSHNDTYLGVGFVGGNNMEIYKRDLDTFTKLTTINPFPPNRIDRLDFSPDDKYLALGSSVSPFLQLYERDGDTFTLLSNPPQPPSSVEGVDFSQDGTYLVTGGGGWNGVTVYKRGTGSSMSIVFTYRAGNGTYPVAFSAGSKFLAVGSSVSPFLYILKRNGDNFSKLPNPSSIPSGSVTSVAFNKDGEYMILTSALTPYTMIYKIDGDIFTNITSTVLSTSPPSVSYTQNGCAFSRGDGYLGVATSSSPYLFVYKKGA